MSQITKQKVIKLEDRVKQLNENINKLQEKETSKKNALLVLGNDYKIADEKYIRELSLKQKVVSGRTELGCLPHTKST